MLTATLLGEIPTPTNGNRILPDTDAGEEDFPDFELIARLKKLDQRLAAFNNFMRKLIPEA